MTNAGDLSRINLEREVKRWDVRRAELFEIANFEWESQRMGHEHYPTYIANFVSERMMIERLNGRSDTNIGKYTSNGQI